MDDKDNVLITIKEAAQIMNMPVKDVEYLIKNKCLQCYTFGKFLRRVLLRDVQNFKIAFPVLLHLAKTQNK